MNEPWDLSMNVLILIVVGVALGARVAANKVYDMILNRQFERANDVWRNEGSPIGYNWAPPETTLAGRFLRFKGGQARRWLLRTPAWALSHEDVRRLLSIYRLLELVFALGIVAVITLVGLAPSR